ncbi:uncharacterized protein [Asterias amurensis]|uniref:uncharacterized protein n=1 Tax=Asterias amurensis TaxID=7602 RepID=UPI003AB2CA31
MEEERQSSNAEAPHQQESYNEIIQVYAPTTSHDDEETKSIYDEADQALGADKTTYTIILGDFNAKAGLRKDLEEKGPGPFGTGERNERGERLLDFVSSRNLFIVNDQTVSDTYNQEVHAILDTVEKLGKCDSAHTKTSKDTSMDEIQQESPLSKIGDASLHPDVLANAYNKHLSDLLEKHAPLQSKTLTLRPSTSWFTSSINIEKLKRKKLEQRWRKSQLTINKDMYKLQRNKVVRLINEAESHNYQNLIDENRGDCRQIFPVIDSLLHRKAATVLPTHTTPVELANRFSRFFQEKIKVIRSGCEISGQSRNADDQASELPVGCELRLETVSQPHIEMIIRKSPPKSFHLDPLPTSLLKTCLSEIAPIVTLIANSSITTENDLLQSTDEGKVSILVLLDLSAAFDTLDHNILLQRLKSRIGLSQGSLDWFSSYLLDRCQRVKITSSSEGASYPLEFGVPQGSLLGPVLFNIYLLPLSDIIRRHNLRHHFYADDTQLYISATPTQSDVYIKTSSHLLIFNHTPKELQGMIQELSEESIKAGLNMNMKKTKVMMSNNSQNFKVAVKGKDFEIVDHYIYLGKNITFNNKTGEEIKRRIQLGWVKFGTLSYIFRDHALPISLKRQVFDQCIIPVLLC